ncbi:MAG TPA: hypothetical protein VMW66_01050, partial [Elusimicrobiales bacterium]|nr:hypothetical protein [Elusimicrobiales bacterium]
MALTTKDLQNLYRFNEELNRPFRNTRELLSCGLSLIAEFLKLDQVSFFVWDPMESVLALRLVWRGGVCMDIEEDVHVPKNSPLRIIFAIKKVYNAKNFYYPAYYTALKWRGYVSRIGPKFNPYHKVRMGVLRLTRFKKSWFLTGKEKEFVNLLSEELARKMNLSELNQFHR